MTASLPVIKPRLVPTACGPIETVVVGTGVPVIVLHGSPGGLDAAELMSRFLPRDQIAAILVSRPGYLGTELGDRKTVDAQAELLAALLDELGIDRAGVLTWSGGGPAGYRLAVRHPDRVSALVGFAAVSQAYHLPETDLATRLMFTTRGGRWVMRVLAAHQPKQYIAGALSGEGDLTEAQLAQRVDEVFADPTKREFVLALGPTAGQGSDRKIGYHNDLEQFAQITSLELEQITAPTLIIQGTADSDLPPGQSDYAAATIPGAELITLDTGTHLALYTHSDATQTQQRVVQFFLAAGS
ncbi:MAG: alpha/beta hydrolase fold protein [Pseudonocardiales bacterium]|nr:alpha/beta hydrolase fold protein [Pseudonocardiales bacterium]